WLSVTTALLAGCGQGEPAKPPPILVSFAVAKAQDTPLYREFSSQFEATNEVAIRPQVGGIIVAKQFADGAMVRKGQPLYVIDPREYRAALAGAQAQLAGAQANAARARQDVARYGPLVKEDAISRQVYDNAVQAASAGAAQVNAAQAGVAQAQLAVSYTVVRSPLSGQIGTTNFNVGALVSPSGPELARVSGQDAIYAYFSASEQDLLSYSTRDPRSRAESGRDIELTLADGSVYPFKGTIDFVDRALDPATGSSRIRAVFPNPEHKLRPGMFGKVRIKTETKTGAIVIPDKAVIDQLGTNFVLVIGKDNKIEQRQVQAGPHVGDAWVILSGLKAGERVVVEGVQKAMPGAEVKPMPMGAKPPAAAPAAAH
ncbi:MAG: efflux RND transporter periplasmic adaptor subunit, partial [Sphingomonadales bacterium]|nr:efflux RND transporter periplasmic adaptor subunit [Sphingomonadales bacterium]